MPFLRNNFNSKNKKKIWKKSFPISLAASDKCAWNCKLSANARRNLDLSFKVPKKAKIPKRKKNRFDINSNRVAKAKSVINIHEIHNSHVQHGAHFEIQLMTCGGEAVGGEEGGEQQWSSCHFRFRCDRKNTFYTICMAKASHRLLNLCTELA